jgi:plasmid stabilization system protein ParE
MRLPVRFHPAAEIELTETADFYDLDNPGLGGDFIAEVEHALAQIAEVPDAAPLVGGHIRRRVLLRFPYSILYAVIEDEVRVLAVAHHKRRPHFWQGRA